MGERSRHMREAVKLLDARGTDFEYDGEMAVNVALNPARKSAYPFMRLKGPANVLIMPAIHSASISTRLVQELGGATVIGPILIGLEKPVQIASLGASASDIQMMAAIAAFNPSGQDVEPSASVHHQARRELGLLDLVGVPRIASTTRASGAVASMMIAFFGMSSFVACSRLTNSRSLSCPPQSSSGRRARRRFSVSRSTSRTKARSIDR